VRLPTNDPLVIAVTPAYKRAAAQRLGRNLMVTRTTHRSTAGKKLYAVRDAKGRFKDIQTYERAHRADLAKKSKAEKAKKT
jgi:hypothetical protein